MPVDVIGSGDKVIPFPWANEVTLAEAPSGEPAPAATNNSSAPARTGHDRNP